MKWQNEHWWHEEQYQRMLAPELTPERIDAAIEAVAGVFDQRWTDRNEPHPAWMFLLPRGTVPLSALLELGFDLLTVEDALRFPSVVHDLRQASHYDSTRLELTLAALLKRRGHGVEFRPPLPDGKRADLKAEVSGQQVYFEVKWLAQSELQLATMQLSFAIISAIGDLQRSEPWSRFPGVGYDIELTDHVNGLLGTDAQSDQATVQGLVRSIVQEIGKRFANADPPFDFSIARLARIQIGRHAKCTLGGPTIDPTHDLKRILRKHLKDAGAQLHPSHPGILVFQTRSILDPSMTQLVAEQMFENQTGSSHVSAGVFLPVYSSFPVRASMFPAFAVLNPAANTRATALKAYDDLAAAFGIASIASIGGAE